MVACVGEAWSESSYRDFSHKQAAHWRRWTDGLCLPLTVSIHGLEELSQQKCCITDKDHCQNFIKTVPMDVLLGARSTSSFWGHFIFLRKGLNVSIQFSSIQFYLYSAKSMKLSQGALESPVLEPPWSRHKHKDKEQGARNSSILTGSNLSISVMSHHSTLSCWTEHKRNENFVARCAWGKIVVWLSISNSFLARFSAVCKCLFFLASKAGYSPHCNYVPCKLINLNVNTATLANLMHIHKGLNIHEQMSDQTLSEP